MLIPPENTISGEMDLGNSAASQAIRFDFLQGVAHGRSLAEHHYFRTAALDPVSGRNLLPTRVKRFRDGWEEGLVAAAIAR